MSNTSLLKGYFGEYEGQNLEDEKPVEKPSIFRMWKSDSPKPEISRERSMNITESIIRQNCHEKVEEGLNKLRSMELQYVYLLESMAFHFGSSPIAVPGLAEYLQDLSRHEKKHALKVRRHMIDRGLTVNFDDIVKPSVSNWGNPLTAMVTCLDALKSLNDNWQQLHKLTIKYEDPCTEVLVKKFICEHVSLIRLFGSHVINLKRIGDNPTGLYLYDLKSFRGEVTPKVDILDTDFDTIRN